ncbi:hypothetical protein EZS27_014446 [termite gut metagenome]|uniref:Uncharacterized protein n=1 Tax=termite gut metagenome TaxID=433724 RepID=A0A5J4RW60_9ZZZZ
MVLKEIEMKIIEKGRLTEFQLREVQRQLTLIKTVSDGYWRFLPDIQSRVKTLDMRIDYCKMKNRNEKNKEERLTESQLREVQRQLALTKGTKVCMTGAEAEMENLKGKVFTVIHGPQIMCGEFVVWLDKYSGAYACEYLVKVEE